jgi:fatty acid desaturase
MRASSSAASAPAPAARARPRTAWERRPRARALARVFRHPIDVVPAGVLLAVFAAQLALFFGADGLAPLALGMLLLFPVQVNFAGTCHNHHHLPTFRHPLANRAFEVVMFLLLGMLPYGYTLHHNLGHHVRYLDPARDPNRWRRTDGTPMGAWEFAVRLVLRMYPDVVAIGREHPVVYRKFLRMAGVCALVLGALLALDPARALVLWVLPMPVALLLQAQATWYQHAGVDSADPLAASRSAVGPLYNLRTLNLGYHTAHHLKPGLHWSRLPAFHAEIAHRIPAELLVGGASLRAPAPPRTG